MALKGILGTKAEIDALPEAVRGLYAEKDGKFFLDIDGGFVSPQEVTDLKSKVAEFRDTNVSLLKKVGDLEPQLKKFEGLDPEEYKRLKKDHEDLVKKSGGKKDDDIEALITRAIDAATKPITEKLAAEEAARKAAEGEASRARFREIVTAEAKKKGVRDNSLRHVIRDAEEKFELISGAIKAKAGVKNAADPLKDYTPADWLEDLSKSDGNLFEDSNGGGASPQDGRPRAGVKTLINPTPLEMGQHATAIAKGEMVVVRQ